MLWIMSGAAGVLHDLTADGERLMHIHDVLDELGRHDVGPHRSKSVVSLPHQPVGTRFGLSPGRLLNGHADVAAFGAAIPLFTPIVLICQMIGCS